MLTFMLPTPPGISILMVNFQLSLFSFHYYCQNFILTYMTTLYDKYNCCFKSGPNNKYLPLGATFGLCYKSIDRLNLLPQMYLLEF